jgi:undecaprenyl-diphosphatase
MPDWIAIVLLGVIEGVTEFLPVSSTGHLLLAENLGWLPRQSDLFNVVIQGGAVLAVLLVFSARVRQLMNRWREPAARDYVAKLAAAFLLTGVGGLVLEKTEFKLPEEPGPVAWATLIGGVVILGIERWLKTRKVSDDVTWVVALCVGAAQLVAAVFPGASRSGTTILMGLALGVSRPAATEFSFLLGIPTLLSAGALKIFKAWRHSGGASEDWAMVGLGTIVAAVTAFLVVKWLLRFVQHHTFVAFGWYRIVLGVAILALIWFR